MSFDAVVQFEYARYVDLLVGDCRTILPTLPANSFHTCITSPPYFGLRSYLPDVIRLKPSLSPEKRAAVIAELAALNITPVDY